MSDNMIEVARELFTVLEEQNAERAVRVVASDNFNVTASASPPACQIPGPAGAVASSAWLRHAFSDLRFEVDDSAVGDDTVWLRLRMIGVHSGPFVRFHGGVASQVIPPTHRHIDVEQIHLVKIRNGQTIRHEALRDDLGMLGQLGVFPPGPAALKMAMWRFTGRAAGAAADVTAVAAAAAEQARAHEKA